MMEHCCSELPPSQACLNNHAQTAAAEQPADAAQADQLKQKSSARRWKKPLSLLVSALLAVWLIWFVSPQDLWGAFSRLDWPLLLPLTVLFILGLYLWDGVCLWRLFDDSDQRLAYGTALHARGYSYLFGIFNYELGQGLLAWILARAQAKSMLSAVGRCLVLAYVDLCILFAVGFIGAILHGAAKTRGIAIACGIALAVLVLGSLLARFSSARLSWLAHSSIGQWLRRSWDLSWKQITPLFALRLVYFMLGMLYVVVGLWICDYPVDAMLILSVVPIVAIVNALPISFSGLGTREATLLVLLQPEEPANLLAFSLVWTTSMILGRAVIGLGHFWGASLTEPIRWRQASLAE